MSRRLRILAMLLGPLPIVLGSVALTDWMRGDSSGPLAPNTATIEAGAALGAEKPQPPAPPAPEARDELAQECQQVAERLGKELGEKCQVLVRAPYVVGGDLAADELDAWYRRTIGPASRAMSLRYFRTPPSKPITVLLFEAEPSYNEYAKKLFDDEGVSVYGYYKPHLRTLVMNISTGGGTLIHELTHALMAFDFPRVPDWFNEGLASLHEGCRIREDRRGLWIEGRVNWRLPGLQKAIAKQRLRSLEKLITEDDFRGDLEGLNYAQARYFCLYLQRHGLLEEFYAEFRRRRRQDEYGAATALALFPDKTWAQLDDDFQRWVMTLEAPQ